MRIKLKITDNMKGLNMDERRMTRMIIPIRVILRSSKT